MYLVRTLCYISSNFQAVQELSSPTTVGLQCAGRLSCGRMCHGQAASASKLDCQRRETNGGNPQMDPARSQWLQQESGGNGHAKIKALCSLYLAFACTVWRQAFRIMSTCASSCLTSLHRFLVQLSLSLPLPPAPSLPTFIPPSLWFARLHRLCRLRRLRSEQSLYARTPELEGLPDHGDRA